MALGQEAPVAPRFTKARALICASICNFMIGAFFFFSNINPYVAAYLRQYNPQVTTNDTLVVIPVYFVCQSLGTLLSIRFVRRFGEKAVINWAYAVYALCSLAMVFVKSYWTFVFLFGCVTGLCVGISVVSVFYIPWTYFPNNKPIVTGVCSFTAGMSASILSPVSTFIVNPNNIRDYQTDPSVYNRVPLLFLYLSLCYGGLSIINFVLQPAPYEEKTVETLAKFEKHPINTGIQKAEIEMQIIVPISYSKLEPTAIGSIRGSPKQEGKNVDFQQESHHLNENSLTLEIGQHFLPPHKEEGNVTLQNKEQLRTQSALHMHQLTTEAIRGKDLFVPQTKIGCPSIKHAVCSQAFMLLSLMVFTSSIYNFFMNSIWKQFYSTKIVVSDSQMALILSYGSFANSIARVLSGVLMERYGFKLIYLVAAGSSVISSFTINFILDSYLVGAVYSMMMFSSLGIQLTIFPVVCAKIFGTQIAASVYPFIFCFFTVANLTQYFLLKFIDDWTLMLHIYGVLAVVGTVAGLLFESDPSWADEQADYQASQLTAEGAALNTTPLLLK